MSFIKINKIGNRYYGYLAQSYRPSYGSAPHHRILKYLGPIDGPAFSKSTRTYDPMRPSFIEEFPKDPRMVISELKEDGTRVIGYFNKKGQALINRRNVNKTELYPELRNSYKQLNFKNNLVLDGEIVALKDGKSDFKTLSERDRLKDKVLIYKRAKTHPLEYHVFDVLSKDGKDLTNLPIEERKKILDSAVPDHLKTIKEIQSEPLNKILNLAKKNKEEGIILKNKGSTYQEGKLSKDWQKLKLLKENDIVILGYSKGTGKRENEFGAILTGVYDNGKFRYTGRVGTGFNDEQLKQFKKQFDSLTTKNPPEILNLPKEKDITFIKPKLVARVRFLQLTKDNIMREGRFINLREDITAKDTHLSKIQSFKLPPKSFSSLKLGSKLIEVEKKGRTIKTRNPEDVSKIAKEVEKKLIPLSNKLSLAGSIRRKKPANDIDIVLIPKDKEKIRQYLSAHGQIESSGEKKISSFINGVKVDVYFADKQTFPSSLLFLTGPTGANIYHRKIAKEKGWKLNQYGLFNRKTGSPIAFKSESEIYNALGSTYRKPELRGLPR